MNVAFYHSIGNDEYAFCEISEKEVELRPSVIIVENEPYEVEFAGFSYGLFDVKMVLDTKGKHIPQGEAIVVR